MKLIMMLMALLFYSTVACADGKVAQKEPPPQARIDDQPLNPCAGKTHCNLNCREVAHPNYKGGPWMVTIRKCAQGSSSNCPVQSIVAVPAGTDRTYACGKPDEHACVEWHTDEGKLKSNLWYFNSPRSFAVAGTASPGPRVVVAQPPPTPRIVYVERPKPVVKYNVRYASADRRDTCREVREKWRGNAYWMRRSALSQHGCT